MIELNELAIRHAIRTTDTRQSIRTRFHGPTNHRSDRISVDSYGYSNGVTAHNRKRLFMNYDHDLSSPDNHKKAAQMWLNKNNPNTVIHGTGLGFEGDYYWTWVPMPGHLQPDEDSKRRYENSSNTLVCSNRLIHEDRLPRHTGGSVYEE